MRRVLKWVAFGWSALMILWIVGGFATVDEGCDEATYVEACEAGAGIGITIGVMVLVFFWVAGLAVIALLWVVSKPEPKQAVPPIQRAVPPPPPVVAPPDPATRRADDPPGFF